ncbi:hypothetical protein B4Q13_15860, partial [Lacticaseibacillus rhamnosus]
VYDVTVLPSSAAAGQAGAAIGRALPGEAIRARATPDGIELSGRVASPADAIDVADFKKFLQLLAPFAPHVADELWSMFGEKKSIHISGWPTYDAKKLVSETMTIVVQVNSKNKAELAVARDASADDIKALALGEERVVAAGSVTSRRRVVMPSPRPAARSSGPGFRPWPRPLPFIQLVNAWGGVHL